MKPFRIAIYGIGDPGPLMTVRVSCAECGHIITSRTYDASAAPGPHAIEERAQADAETAEAHECWGEGVPQ